MKFRNTKGLSTKIRRRNILKFLSSLFFGFNLQNIFGMTKASKKLGFFYDSIFFQSVFSKDHPENPKRLEVAINEIRINKLLQKN